MFKKAVLAKFEWSGLPEPLNDLYVENLLLDSSDNNFAVTEKNGQEVWSLYTVLTYGQDFYKLPATLQIANAWGVTFTTSDFCLYSNFKSPVESDALIIHAHEQLLRKINRALSQHVTASELVAHIRARSSTEAKILRELYKDFRGVKILDAKETQTAELFENKDNVDFVQFQITPRMAELETLKHDIENDLFLRLGIDTQIDKTHLTNYNIQSSEQARDLINSYELKRRKDFCRRLNIWRRAHNSPLPDCDVEIHKITQENAITKTTTTEVNNGENS